MSASTVATPARRPLSPARVLRMFVIGYALVEAVLIGVALLVR